MLFDPPFKDSARRLGHEPRRVSVRMPVKIRALDRSRRGVRRGVQQSPQRSVGARINCPKVPKRPPRCRKSKGERERAALRLLLLLSILPAVLSRTLTRRSPLGRIFQRWRVSGGASCVETHPKGHFSKKIQQNSLNKEKKFSENPD